jgi:hypothetical protein
MDSDDVFKLNLLLLLGRSKRSHAIEEEGLGPAMHTIVCRAKLGKYLGCIKS